MKMNIKVFSMFLLTAMALILPATLVLSQEVTVDTMKAFIEKLRADKKLLVSENMQLTETEAKGFWPVYDDYQADLFTINQKIARLINSYAEAYGSGNISDENAKKFTAEMVEIAEVEGKLPGAYAGPLSKVLPPNKVVRYLQIENKIRAVVKFDLAGEIPLLP